MLNSAAFIMGWLGVVLMNEFTCDICSRGSIKSNLRGLALRFELESFSNWPEEKIENSEKKMGKNSEIVGISELFELATGKN